MSHRTILTGARGNIGRALADAFPDDVEVVRISRTAGAQYQAIEQLRSPALMARADSLIHLAWSTVPFTSDQAVGQEWSIDLPLLFEICTAVKNARRTTPLHLVFISTCAVYGNHDGIAASETHPARPLGWYARAKLAAEEIIEGWAKSGVVKATTLRVSNVYGWRAEGSSPQGIIPRLVDAAISGRTLTLWGEGSATKDYLHVRDLATAMEGVLRSGAIGTFNVAQGRSTSVNALVAEVESITGRAVNVIRSPGFPWDVTHTLVDCSKIKARTGWEAQTTLADGVREIVRWKS